MKRFLLLLLVILFILPGCSGNREYPDIVATTLPVYDFAVALCDGTDIKVGQLITQSVSCLHDYALQVSQMKDLERANVIAISGAGLEDFMADAMHGKEKVVDCSAGISLADHGADPHIWLSPALAMQMTENLAHGIAYYFPEKAEKIQANKKSLLEKLEELQNYGKSQLQDLESRDLITFHDGFSYLAQEFELNILSAVEEEPGSEVSAGQLKQIIGLVRDHHIPAIFTEKNGSDASAKVISAETGAGIYCLDMALCDTDYFSAMRNNIDRIKEALE